MRGANTPTVDKVELEWPDPVVLGLWMVVVVMVVMDTLGEGGIPVSL